MRKIILFFILSILFVPCLANPDTSRTETRAVAPGVYITRENSKVVALLRYGPNVPEKTLFSTSLSSADAALPKKSQDSLLASVKPFVQDTAALDHVIAAVKNRKLNFEIVILAQVPANNPDKSVKALADMYQHEMARQANHRSAVVTLLIFLSVVALAACVLAFLNYRKGWKPQAALPQEERSDAQEEVTGASAGGDLPQSVGVDPSLQRALQKKDEEAGSFRTKVGELETSIAGLEIALKQGRTEAETLKNENGSLRLQLTELDQRLNEHKKMGRSILDRFFKPMAAAVEKKSPLGKEHVKQQVLSHLFNIAFHSISCFRYLIGEHNNTDKLNIDQVSEGLFNREELDNVKTSELNGVPRSGDVDPLALYVYELLSDAKVPALESVFIHGVKISKTQDGYGKANL